MYPIFDPAELNDEELLKQIQKVRMHIGQHINLGHDSLIHSMETTLAIMEEEQEMRQLKMQAEIEKGHQKRIAKMKRHPDDMKPYEDDDEDDEPNETITIGHIEGVDD